MIEIHNNQIVDIDTLEISSYDELRTIAYKNKFRCVSTAVEKSPKLTEYGHEELNIYIVMSNNMSYYLAKVIFTRGEKCKSISDKIPSWTNFEREMYEEFNINFINHPWLKPVRFAHDRELDMEIVDYPFFKINGDGVHEVAVGPVHAGVIEPGHFRFMCRGEVIDHLEIQLGYQHRGVEKLLTQKNIFKSKTLVESITGDSTVINSFLYASSVETLTNTKIPERAKAIRVIAIELERAALHLSTVSGIANDVAYLMGSAFGGATRTYVINSLQSICGNRFGHGLIGIGGVNFDIDSKLNEELTETLKMVYHRVSVLMDALLDSPSVLARLEHTGIVNHDTAKAIGLTGVAARAAGLNVDSRYNMNNKFYHQYRDDNLGHYAKHGDVLARTYQRFVEIKQSLTVVLDILKNLPEGECKTKVDFRTLELPGRKLIFSVGEGPRGENSHLIITNSEGNIPLLYKVKDPSFVSWFALALSVRGNQISDFPLCNKSFDLSYCGSDL